MDELEMNHCEDYEEDLSAHSSESPFACKVFGDPNPDLAPRVGDQYQVEVPSLVTKPKSLCLTKWSYGAPQDVLQLGLPISVMWVEEEITRTKIETDAFDKTKSVKSECVSEMPKVDPADSKSYGAIKQEKSIDLAPERELKSEQHQERITKGHHPVPGSSSNTWSDFEEATFLLGLYIFGKDFVLVEKFVESKTMGDIQAFYYGKFFKSEKYLRWSVCMKTRSRKCIYGQRIFTGPRQQELMSRLLPRVSEKCKNSVLQVSKTLVDGKISLDKYVCTLKGIFGLKALVEAVGIGKGKDEDLTGMTTTEPPVKSIRVEVPVGKACASLTPLEIVTFLTGGYRLSKTRSNDIFWEAVWPRLLARGWHSEQPNNHGFTACARQPLVFLLPGVNKFSRKKLVKGEHYFDSVPDVLSKVALEPGLLELDLNETKMDQEEYPETQCHCYLKPRIPNRDIADVMKYTVVDTSLPRGGAFKVRELRTLPAELACISMSGIRSEDHDSFEESSDEEKPYDTGSFRKIEADVSKNTKVISNGTFSCHGSDSAIVNGQISKEKSNKSNSTHPRKGVEVKSSQKRNANDICPAPTTKRRRRPSACSRPEKGRGVSHIMSVGPKLRDESASCSVSQVDPSKLKPSFASSLSNGEDPREKKSQPRRLIDLNLPVPLDTETDEPCMIKIPQHVPPHTESALTGVGPTRKSTRNRPLTTKALEALACGYLSTSPKRKARDPFTGGENPSKRPSRRPRDAGVRVTKDFRDGVVESSKGEEQENSDVFGKLQVCSEGK